MIKDTNGDIVCNVLMYDEKLYDIIYLSCIAFF